MDSWGALSVEFAASAVSARNEGSTKRPKTVLDAPRVFPCDCRVFTFLCL